MRRQWWWAALLGCLLVMFLAGTAGGDWSPNSLVASVVGNAGAPATGPGVAANGTLGQSTPIGTASGGGIVLHAGFWGIRWPEPTAVVDPDIPVWTTELLGSFPNPFNPRTSIAFTLARQARVRLEVFDAKGRLVRTLADETRPAGRHQVDWNGTDSRGCRPASGLYFIRLHAGDYESVMKMTLVK